MKVLIIEDEFFAYERLVKLLKKFDESIEIVGHLDSISSSVKWFEASNEVDLVFMDIQLADGSSFKIFDKTKIDTPIIFVTAYDKFALDAFKVNSISYLLKPISEDKLRESLEKYNSLKRNFKSEQSYDNLLELINKSAVKSYKERILVQVGATLKPISCDKIAFFFIDGGRNYIITKKGNKYAVSYKLDEIENEINSSTFFRINRQMIISIDVISSVESYFSNRLLIKSEIKFPEDIVVSKRKVSAFKLWLE